VLVLLSNSPMGLTSVKFFNCFLGGLFWFKWVALKFCQNCRIVLIYNHSDSNLPTVLAICFWVTVPVAVGLSEVLDVTKTSTVRFLCMWKDTNKSIYLCLVKNMGTAKGYMFRVFAHSATSFTSSDEFKYPMPEDIKNRAITAGLVGELLSLYSAIPIVVDPDLQGSA